MPPWTHSRLEAYGNCPRQFYHLKVAKDVTEAPSEQQLWGNRVHEALEVRIRDGIPLPEGMQQWEKLASSLESLPGDTYCEMELAVDATFQPCEWDKSWTRGIADLVKVYDKAAAVFDYKTGKRKLTSQLRLYAVKLFALMPDVDVVSTGFVWLKDRRIDRERITRDDIPKVWNEYLPKVHQLELSYEKGVWPKRPSGLCRGWCPVGRSRCEFCIPKKG